MYNIIMYYVQIIPISMLISWLIFFFVVSCYLKKNIQIAQTVRDDDIENYNYFVCR